MSLRFFLDQCVPNFVASELQECAAVVFRLKDHLPPNSPDPVVIAKAQELDCVLVSLNGDFADILRYPPAQYKGIIAIQLRNQPSILPALMTRLKSFIEGAGSMSLYQGKLFVVEVHRIRVWGE